MAVNGGRDLPGPDAHAVSPELVLVDPVLADVSRGWLHPGDDTLVRIERALARRRIAASRQQLLGSVEVPVDVPSRLRVVLSRGVVRLAVASGAALIFAAAVLVGVRVEVKGDPAQAGSTIAPAIFSPASLPSATLPSSPPSTKPRTVRPAPKPRQAGSPRKAAARAQSRSFAWAPVAGASGYHVQFFRGPSLVFSADTIDPAVVVPASWRIRGRTYVLEPGEYQWYVWAVRAGRRASEATVRATLVVER